MSNPVIRRWRGGDMRVIYYSVIAVFVGWGGVALYLAQPRYPLIPGAIIVGVVLLHLYDAWVSRTPQRVLQNVRNQAKQLALMDPIAVSYTHLTLPTILRV